MNFKALVPIIVAVAAIEFFAGYIAHSSSPKVTVSKPQAETIYIRNIAKTYISDRQIRKNIPAWQSAANGAFAQAWNTPRIKLVDLGRKSAPAGAVVATFKEKGPVNGALAYHGLYQGSSQITVYAGTSHYFGYSISVGFTHELFEYLADPNINTWIWHWQREYPYVWAGGKKALLPSGAIWFGEVCDPVEKYAYLVDGVKISDWITPNWFNEQINGGFDAMNLVHQPFTVLSGGYAQFEANGQYYLVQVFAHAGRDAAGFLKGEKLARS